MIDYFSIGGSDRVLPGQRRGGILLRDTHRNIAANQPDSKIRGVHQTSAGGNTFEWSANTADPKRAVSGTMSCGVFRGIFCDCPLDVRRSVRLHFVLVRLPWFRRFCRLSAVVQQDQQLTLEQSKCLMRTGLIKIDDRKECPWFRCFPIGRLELERAFNANGTAGLRHVTKPVRRR